MSDDWVVRHSGGGVVVTTSASAAHVELDRPAAMNAFDFEMTRTLSEQIVELADDDTVRAVLISGRGRAFSTGADIKSAFDTASRGQVGEYLRQWTTPMIMAIRTMRKPVVAAVHGHAVGAGCSLAVACDQVLAAESASFHLAFSRVGLGMDGGAGVTVAARAGFSVASTMALLGEPMSASRAVQTGVADHLVPDDELRARALDLLDGLSTGPTLSFAATKDVLNRHQFGALEEVLAMEADRQEMLLRSDDFAASLEAFAGRRPPEFNGR